MSSRALSATVCVADTVTGSAFRVKPRKVEGNRVNPGGKQRHHVVPVGGGHGEANALKVRRAAVTVTPGRESPVASTTRPAMVPAGLCADAGRATAKAASARASFLKNIDVSFETKTDNI